MKKPKETVARELAERHTELEDSVRKVVRLVSQKEDSPDEPIKLLEVNLESISVGVMPISFGPSNDVPYPSVVVELSGAEYDALQQNKLQLPKDWQLGDVLVDKDMPS